MNSGINGLVVVPWDFSDHSKGALEFATDEFPPENIRVICVLEIPNPYSPDFVIPHTAEDHAIAECRRQFNEQVQPENFPGLQFVTVFGEPAFDIVDYAKQNDASLIVMSTHGRSGIKRLVMGSVAEKVLRTASCPVLILPNALAPAA